MANEYFFVQAGVALAKTGAGDNVVITHGFGSTDFCCFEFATANPIGVPAVRYSTRTTTQVTITNDHAANAWTGTVVLRRAHSILGPAMSTGAGTFAAAPRARYERLFTGITIAAGAPGQTTIYHNLGTPFANLIVLTGCVGAAAGPAVTRPWISASAVPAEVNDSVVLNNTDGANPWTGDVWVMAFPVGTGLNQNAPVFGTKFGTPAQLNTAAYDSNRFLAGANTVNCAAGVVNADIVHNLGNAATWQTFALFGYHADPNGIFGPYVVAIDQGAVGTTTRIGVTAAGGNLVAGDMLIGRPYSIWR
jgi:hypothetical protein